MKRFMLTVALTCVLSVSALAGEMPTMGITSPQTNEIAEIQAPTNAVASSQQGDVQGPTSTLLTTIIIAIITWP